MLGAQGGGQLQQDRSGQRGGLVAGTAQRQVRAAEVDADRQLLHRQLIDHGIELAAQVGAAAGGHDHRVHRGAVAGADADAQGIGLVRMAFPHPATIGVHPPGDLRAAGQVALGPIELRGSTGAGVLDGAVQVAAEALLAEAPLASVLPTDLDA